MNLGFWEICLVKFSTNKVYIVLMIINNVNENFEFKLNKYEYKHIFNCTKIKHIQNNLNSNWTNININIFSTEQILKNSEKFEFV